MIKKTLTIKPEVKPQHFQFLNSIYYKPFHNNELRKEFKDYYNDFLVIVYRNEDTDEKKLKIMPNPYIQFFQANDDVEIKEEHLNQIELDKVHLVKVRNKDLLHTLCDLQNEYEGTSINFKNYCYDNGKPSGEANRFHAYKRFFSSDIDIEDFWKGRFIDTYKNASNSKLTKSYTDIEVDSIGINGFPKEEDALCPINAITVFFEEQMTFFTLLLRNPNNEQIEELENNEKEFRKSLKETLGKEFKYKLFFFDDEMDLIQTYFDLVNKFKPDFNLVYNMKFDIRYILNRIGELNGIDRTSREFGNTKYDFIKLCGEICSHPDFPDYLQTAEFILDTKNNKATDRIDTFRVSSYTQWYDQLTLYASIRKGSGELENYSLSYVAQKELGDDKLNYSEEGYDIKTLPYNDYKMFITYNIKDVLLQYKLEKKNDDLGLLYSIAEITKTRLNKAMRKTVSLKNMAHHFYIDQGYALGNNINIFSGDDKTEKYEGAYVAEPTLNSYTGATINGSKSKYIFNFIIDFDYTALYPSIIRAFNIDPNSQIGRIMFDGYTPTKEYDRGGEFLDNLSTKDIIHTTNKFLGTPTIEEVLEECRMEGLI
jgi:hypothetical protein